MPMPKFNDSLGEYAVHMDPDNKAVVIKWLEEPGVQDRLWLIITGLSGWASPLSTWIVWVASSSDLTSQYVIMVFVTRLCVIIVEDL